ncbi:Conserved_hypothetical protein [Hexamita inflata]|uniref:Uncharacterized protein n=1 Tax=Hexamita inflata TaxID=28002 RepID=A0ABP1HL95_9EUKA
MSDFLCMQLFQSSSVTLLFKAGRLNKEGQTKNERLTAMRCALLFLLMSALTMNELQCTDETLQKVFILTLYVIVEVHRRSKLFKSYSVDGVKIDDKRSENTNVMCCFNSLFLGHYLVYLAQVISMFTQDHQFKLAAYTSIYCENFFSRIRGLCKNNHNVQNFERVFRAELLEEQLGQETGCYVERKSRLGSKTTNRVHIKKLLEEDEVKQLDKLSELIIEIVYNDEIPELDQKFSQIQDFWDSVVVGISKEWCKTKLNTTKLRVYHLFDPNSIKQSRMDKNMQQGQQYCIKDNKVLTVFEVMRQEGKKERKQILPKRQYQLKKGGKK